MSCAGKRAAICGVNVLTTRWRAPRWSTKRIYAWSARDRRSGKRGAGVPRLVLDPELVPAQKTGIDIVALDDALSKLAALDSQQGRLIELRFFGGLSIEETAVVLGVSPATVKREWVTARAWLRRELKRTEGT